MGSEQRSVTECAGARRMDEIQKKLGTSIARPICRREESQSFRLE